MTFYITHNENFTAIFDNTGIATITWNCKRYEFFLGNSRWYIQVVFYFAQY